MPMLRMVRLIAEWTGDSWDLYVEDADSEGRRVAQIEIPSWWPNTFDSEFLTNAGFKVV